MFIKTSIAAALLLSAAGPAAAGQTSQAVSFGDLDLGSPAGIAALDRRIDQAVRRVCGSAHPTDLGAIAQVRQCRAETQVSVSARRNAAVAERSGASGTTVASR